jgi:peroxidase
MHTVFFREHNRIAFGLRAILPLAGDEEIFQRTRAIIGAIMQNIVYGQWLPHVLGDVYMHR